MTKQEYIDKAGEYFTKGYNCAQAVAAAFSDVMGLPEEAVLKLSCPMGGGFARLRYVCGAVSGMGLAAGMVYGNASPDCKAEMYPKTRALADRFKDECGSIICADLLQGMGTHSDPAKPEPRTAEYYKKRSCLQCVQTAAKIMAEDLEANGRI